MSESLFDPTSFRYYVMVTVIKLGLELIPEPEMFIFFEKGIRAGVSYIFNI